MAAKCRMFVAEEWWSWGRGRLHRVPVDPRWAEVQPSGGTEASDPRGRASDRLSVGWPGAASSWASMPQTALQLVTVGRMRKCYLGLLSMCGVW